MQIACIDLLELADSLLLAASYCDDNATAEVLRDDARDALAECCRLEAFQKRSGA